MNPEELDIMLQKSCLPGEQLAFAVVVEGNPQKFMFRSCGPSGRGIVSKLIDYSKKPEFSADLPKEIWQGEVRIWVIFSNIIQARYLTDFRRGWYSHWRAKFGYSFDSWKPSEIAKYVENREIQFQITLKTMTSELVDFKSSAGLVSAISSDGKLRTTLKRISKDNVFRETDAFSIY